MRSEICELVVYLWFIKGLATKESYSMLIADLILYQLFW